MKLKLGKVPVAFPNLPSRRRAVRIHDLHHLLTGYDTDWIGETEISAYEIGAGCGGYGAAWMLNLGAFFTGPFVKPARLFAAFRRGRRCRSLYHESYDDALLGSPLGETRTRLGLDEPLDGPPTLAACAGFTRRPSSSIRSTSASSTRLSRQTISPLRSASLSRQRSAWSAPAPSCW